MLIIKIIQELHNGLKFIGMSIWTHISICKSHLIYESIMNSNDFQIVMPTGNCNKSSSLPQHQRYILQYANILLYDSAILVITITISTFEVQLCRKSQNHKYIMKNQ